VEPAIYNRKVNPSYALAEPKFFDNPRVGFVGMPRR